MLRVLCPVRQRLPKATNLTLQVSRRSLQVTSCGDKPNTICMSKDQCPLTDVRARACAAQARSYTITYVQSGGGLKASTLHAPGRLAGSSSSASVALVSVSQSSISRAPRLLPSFKHHHGRHLGTSTMETLDVTRADTPHPGHACNPITDPFVQFVWATLAGCMGMVAWCARSMCARAHASIRHMPVLPPSIFYALPPAGGANLRIEKSLSKACQVECADCHSTQMLPLSAGIPKQENTLARRHSPFRGHNVCMHVYVCKKKNCGGSRRRNHRPPLHSPDLASTVRLRSARAPRPQIPSCHRASRRAPRHHHL
jgi:hypothetical protein